MKFTYVGNGAFIQGLPATDLDDSSLSPEQRQALLHGMDEGLYIQAPVEAPVMPQKSQKAATAE